PLNEQLTHLPRRKRSFCLWINNTSVRPRHGKTDTADTTLSLEGVGVCHRRRFSEAVSFDKMAFRELFKSFLCFDGQRSRAAHTDTNGRDTIASDLRIVSNCQ